MENQLTEKEIQEKFEYFMKAVIRNKAREIHKRMNRLEENEGVVIKNMKLDLKMDLSLNLNPINLESSGIDVPFRNEALLVALQSLSSPQLEIITENIFFEKKLTNIATEKKLSIDQVKRHKKKALEKIKEIILSDSYE